MRGAAFAELLLLERVRVFTLISRCTANVWGPQIALKTGVPSKHRMATAAAERSPRKCRRRRTTVGTYEIAISLVNRNLVDRLAMTPSN